nr:glycosyltransferase family 4 protein [Bacteroidota bacterium]
MKILILGDASSIHVIKWVNALLDKGNQIAVFSLRDYDGKSYSESPNLKIYSLGFDDSLFKLKVGAFEKLRYFKGLTQIKKIIKDFSPDVLHAHYASSYGMLGALSNFHPFVVSVWGSDVFEF